jgi:microcin C transport system permease protein
MRLGASWQRFGEQRGGMACLAGFLAVFAISLSADVIANDRPLLLEFRGHIYCPLLQPLPGTLFGPAFLPSQADYTDPALQAAIAAHGFAVWPPVRFGPGSIVWNAPAAPSPPSAQNWLGTDEYGRDVLARVLYGLRRSIIFGLGLGVAAAFLGVAAGAVQGFYGGWVDLLGQRLSEIWSGVPQLFLLMIIAALAVPSLGLFVLVLAAFSWMGLAGLVRAEFLRARTADYVRAARALGVPDWRIMAVHMLPNASVAVLSYFPFLVLDSILLLSSLDFLGLGGDAPSLGVLVAQARDGFAPWLGVSAFVALAGLLGLLAGIGTALRKALAVR